MDLNLAKAQDDSTKTQFRKDDSPEVQFRKMVEYEVLMVITDLAEKGKTDQEKIKQMAQYALEIINPAFNLDELYACVVKLDDKYPEFSPVVLKVMQEYEKKYQKKALDEVSNLIRTGRYDDAQAMVKKVLQFKMTE